MRIVVFGASGNCGSHFARLAVARGHEVTAAIRPPARSALPEGAHIVRGDVLDPAFVAAAVAGHDVVMSGLGMRYANPWAKRESPDDFISRATGHILDAMKQSGVRRVSVISAAGVGDSRPGLNLVMRVLLKTSNVGYPYADLERVEALLRDSGLDWQAVRPTTLTHGKATDRVRIAQRFPMTATIPREDVAAFMLRELEAREFTSRTPLITVT